MPPVFPTDVGLRLVAPNSVIWAGRGFNVGSLRGRLCSQTQTKPHRPPNFSVPQLIGRAFPSRQHFLVTINSLDATSTKREWSAFFTTKRSVSTGGIHQEKSNTQQKNRLTIGFFCHLIFLWTSNCPGLIPSNTRT